MEGTRHDVRDDLGLRRVWDRRLDNADNRRRAIAQSDCLSDQRRVAAQRSGPESMGQHRGARGLWPVVGTVDQAAPHRTKSHDVEVRSADDPGAYYARLAEANHREVDG